MSGHEKVVRYRENTGGTGLRQAIFDKLELLTETKNLRDDKERCLAEITDGIMELLSPEPPDMMDIAEVKPSSPAGRRATKKDTSTAGFDWIIRTVLADVKFGYLVSNLQMMKALGSAISVRDTGSREHNYKVTLYAARLGEAVGLREKEIQALIKGSFLHDIGKISIRDSILLKPTGLTDDERETMRDHTLRGTYILNGVRWLDDATEVVVHHHERWDGTGYPDKLEAEEIPLNARIFAIVDVFDALTSVRPYKAAYKYDQAIDYMKRQSGTHFDPTLLDAFCDISGQLYEEIGSKDTEQLQEQMENMIPKHFGIDPKDDRLKIKAERM